MFTQLMRGDGKDEVQQQALVAAQASAVSLATIAKNTDPSTEPEPIKYLWHGDHMIAEELDDIKSQLTQMRERLKREAGGFASLKAKCDRLQDEILLSGVRCEEFLDLASEFSTMCNSTAAWDGDRELNGATARTAVHADAGGNSRMCEYFQSTWTEEEELSRRVGRSKRVTFPVVASAKFAVAIDAAVSSE